MRNPHGTFIWYELLTPDADAAVRFYGDVVGWSGQHFTEGMDYHVMSAGTGVAGIMAAPEGATPRWYGYVGVDDADAAVKDITESGGTVIRAATDMPGVGRMAMVADPQGVPFHVMRGEPDEPSLAFDPEAPGRGAWNELTTSDPAAALAFYMARFGWSKGETMPMGDLGDYQMIDHGSVTIGAVMKRMEDGPPPGWTFYFRVDGIDAAKARVEAGGGSVVMGPQEVPGGQMILLAKDPQGIMFALVAARG